MIGLATSIDAFAGLFACFAAAYLSEKYKPWHIQHVISMLGTGVFFICAPFLTRFSPPFLAGF